MVKTFEVCVLVVLELSSLSASMIRARRLNITGLHEKEAYSVSEECSEETSIQDTRTLFSSVSRTDLSKPR